MRIFEIRRIGFQFQNIYMNESVFVFVHIEQAMRTTISILCIEYVVRMCGVFFSFHGKWDIWSNKSMNIVECRIMRSMSFQCFGCFVTLFPSMVLYFELDAQAQTHAHAHTFTTHEYRTVPLYRWHRPKIT